MANENLKEQVKLQKDLTSSTSEYQQVVAAVLEEISSTNVGLNKAREGYRGLLKIAGKVEEVQEGITRLSAKEISLLKSSTEKELLKLKSGAEILKNKTKLTSAEKAIKTAVGSGLENEKDLLSILDTQIEKRKKIEENLGLTGIVLDNLGRIGVRALGGIGLNLGALQSDFDEVTNTVENLAEKGASKFKIFGAAVAKTGPIFQKVITDPAVVSLVSFDKLKNAFLEVEKSSIAFQRLTGQTSLAAASINTRFATTTQYLELATKLTEQLGINVNNTFSPDTLAAAAEIQNTMGISAEEAGKLAIITQTTSGNFDQIKNSLVDSVSAFNRSNRAAVSQGVVLRDVANTSEDILVSFNNQPGALAQAAAAARRLGLDLSKVDQVATSLLDFESSISNELQAQLITGKNINLEKAREFALANDLEGLSNELFKNSASIAEFSSMNRIQQEAQAQALGLSRQELAKIALQQSINLGLSNKALETAAGITAEDLERASIQESLNMSIQKMAEALAAPAALLASMLDNAALMNTTMIAIGAVGAAKAFVGLARLLKITKAMSKASLLMRIGFGGIAALAATAVAAVAIPALVDKVTQADDAVIDPSGGLVVSGPKGTIQLNSNDSIVAGTNLGGTPAWAERLIAAVEKGGNVYIDGNKAGEALVLGTYKSS